MRADLAAGLGAAAVDWPKANGRISALTGTPLRTVRSFTAAVRKIAGAIEAPLVDVLEEQAIRLSLVSGNAAYTERRDRMLSALVDMLRPAEAPATRRALAGAAS